VRVMQRHGFNWPHGLRDPVHFEISPRRAGYRSSHRAIRSGQQRWVALNRTACAVKTKGQRVAGGKQKAPDKITLQKAAYHRPPTRRR
jgi:hypothetical protein